ncbi:glycoside hydrolase family 43 protein [Aliiglaciecola sp. LCG003]|uniref:glycoside hydrolase family 43 protein n=1 Tax=Aliiglaciecola sp. LCG003 TaxID=3053655 RepID=UPI0025722EFF|nr:glycoside hydrolase family 43 protein [Aliiglaciecola sp. LCG003]WJG08656.1 glycoside hydrolase family 43 protein [Aliiglaciecola sp. LCG003]
MTHRNVWLTINLTTLFLGALGVTACEQSSQQIVKKDSQVQTAHTDTYGSINTPLVTDIYTADPSAHVFEGKLYIYPSHDVQSDIPENDSGDHFAMRDYHVLSVDAIGQPAKVHNVALALEDIPWAGKQLWAPDAAYKDGKYYLYFPARDKQDIFKIGVAVGDSPIGPFTAQPQPLEGSFSIDPAVYAADDGHHYLYFGGIWGGQLQHWQGNTYAEQESYPQDDEPALMPKVVKLSDDMLSFDGEITDVQLLDTDGQPITQGDADKRFFEAAWLHKYNGRYYFSYSTGDTHKIVYGVGDNPLGPFTYQGVILNPVIGWTNHHSIAEYNGQWYLFYHDSTLSGGKTHLRSVKMTPLTHLEDGSIQTIDAYEQQ